MSKILKKTNIVCFCDLSILLASTVVNQPALRFFMVPKIYGYLRSNLSIWLILGERLLSKTCRHEFYMTELLICRNNAVLHYLNNSFVVEESKFEVANTSTFEGLHVRCNICHNKYRKKEKNEFLWLE